MKPSETIITNYLEGRLKLGEYYQSVKEELAREDNTKEMRSQLITQLQAIHRISSMFGIDLKKEGW